MNKDERRKAEKERLMKEVLGKKRAYEKEESSDVKLTFDADTPKEQSTLKSADDAIDALNAILRRQQKDIAELTKQTEEVVEQPIVTDDELDKMEQELKDDYGVSQPVDNKEIFETVNQEVQNEIKGQQEAIQQLLTSFRRPYVMGTQAGKPKNVVLVTGPEGTGRHASISLVCQHLAKHNLLSTSEIYTIDMSRYTSGSQEGIFLQDLYEALSGNGEVICFENFETGFPSFLRMINSLAVDGSVVLSKRYVLSKGVLVEAQTGLVRNAVDHLKAEGKYLVFITNQKPSKVQDAFGADFMYHVLDTVTYQPLNEEAIASIIELQTKELISKTKNNLKITITVNEEVKEWVKKHFDKTRGAESITDIFYDFYVSLSQAVLSMPIKENIELQVKDDIPSILVDDMQVRLPREKTSEEEIQSVNEELNEIVGLETVKKYITSLQANIAMQKRRKEQGMKTASIAKHMIFTGNPGTGKTTIARLLARYMKAIGALSEGQLVEVTRADLVAQYVGQTAPLTMSVIKSAIGGILFIDEAYSLYRGKDDSFGLEAIDTLVKAMEDQRDNLIVILAGYKKEMAGFLESNSGLKSRFPNLINFPDYTGEELTKIAQIQAKSKGYFIAEEATTDLQKYFDEVQSINAAEAGNGRLARNVIEEAILKQSERLLSNPQDDMSELRKQDFNFTIKVKPSTKEEGPSLEELAKLLQK